MSALSNQSTTTDDAKRQRAAKTSDLQVFDWPPPHLTVSYRQTTYAFGRQEVAALGYSEFKRVFFSTVVWKPSHGVRIDPRLMLDRDYKASTFKDAAVLLGVFCSVYGEHDACPVTLTSVGWKAMVENLISIQVVHD